jgi:hypothetical protein
MNDRSTAPNPAIEVNIEVEVDVFRVAEMPSGSLGNTASGRYLFIFSKDVVHVDAVGVNTRIAYRLSPGTIARGFSFIDAYIDDSKFQLVGPYLECTLNDDSGDDPRYDTLWFDHSNTHASLISISLQVEDHQAPPELRRVAYDPQVTNKPGRT